MKKRLLSVGIVSGILALSACDKKDPAPSEPPADQAAPTTDADTQSHSDTHSSEHAHESHEGHEHIHDNHTHGDHSHHHAPKDSRAYLCDNNKTVYVAVHDHEGEKEAHLTVDDIVYDLHPDTNNANHYVADDGVITGKGMLLKINGDQVIVNEYTNEKEGSAIFSCKVS